MEAIPAIDILEGRCVRLAKGDFAQATHYAENPAEQARSFAAAGITRLHMVDLDGARSGQSTNIEILRKVSSSTSLKVDFGGGIASREVVSAAFEGGAEQLTVGSVAIREPQKFEQWTREFGADRFIVALDVKDGQVAIRGWQETSPKGIREVLPWLLHLGVLDVLCTDVARDGMLSGPATDLYTSLLAEFPTTRLWASGGIRSIADLQDLRRLGCYAAVVGRALYEDKISVRELVEFNAY